MGRLLLPTPRSSSISFLSRKHRCLHLLQSCSSMNDLRRIQAIILTSGLGQDRFLTSEMLRFCSLSPAGSLDHARALLSSSPDPILSSYNHLIRGYSHSGSPGEAIPPFLDLRRRGLRPNELTFPFVLKSCASLSALSVGRQVHGDAVKSGVGSVVYVQNTLMHFYSTCGEFRNAEKVFDEMPLRNVVSWTTIMTACVENLVPGYSVSILVRMRRCGFEPDRTTLIVLLSAAAEIGSLGLGRWVHGQIVWMGLEVSLQLGTALVNMYAKCGAIRCAGEVFDRMPERNVWTWSAMILGLAQHGLAEKALELFSEMKNALIEPNYVTFLGVFCACSHAGLVDDGYRFFHEMVHVHGIQPMMAHYSAMVDVIGRKGRLRNALDFILRMPVEPNAVVWRTLLSSCHLHIANDSTGIGEIARRRLLALEPERSGNYVMAANMLSDDGSWEEAAKMRMMMREGGLKKTAGESCLELSGSISRFVSGDDSCANCEIINQILDGLILNMKMSGDIDTDASDYNFHTD